MEKRWNIDHGTRHGFLVLEMKLMEWCYLLQSRRHDSSFRLGRVVYV